MTTVFVLGGDGMLGGMITRILARETGMGVRATSRSANPPALPGVTWAAFDARDPLDELLGAADAEWVINCIGLVKPRIDESDVESLRRALEVNSLFPRRLADAAARGGQRVIEIATDGVFSGTHGPYRESALHDPCDVYGKTKSLGEHTAGHVVRLRCSIIGPEATDPPLSLLGRTLGTPAGATLTGFSAQLWNGVTTLHFARLCAAVMGGAAVDGTQHIVPGDSMTKAELLACITAAFGRDDLTVTRVPGPSSADRRLTTLRPEVNRRLWQAAGYREPPTIASMVAELAALPD